MSSSAQQMAELRRHWRDGDQHVQGGWLTVDEVEALARCGVLDPLRSDDGFEVWRAIKRLIAHIGRDV